ncbi:hypothetical protein C8A01DRAFT_39301 [Parachaetomium inaequale]|uniref:NWD NACHT-NTPase N-terminal domain-containing protein n=1 Tax=Parachaetomium inaequale TaxID=2588326 RepID=A0AAN6SP01_9PEZI|nr:hypothetical protein C8A01DRAFT_39301 [Parachaetomium inaequale]
MPSFMHKLGAKLRRHDGNTTGAGRFGLSLRFRFADELVDVSAGPKRAPGRYNGGELSVEGGDVLWDEAYDQLRSQQPDLVLKYEQIVCHATSKDFAETTPTHAVPADDPSARRKQMLALANARVAKFENRRPVLAKVAMAITVVNALSDRIAAALEASPPASLAFAGLRLILNGCARGIAASQDCLDGLTRVVSRLEWYLGLGEFILADGGGDGPDTLEPSLIAAAGVVSAYLRAGIVDLFVALIQYQIKSVCAYYRTNQLVTFLRDLADLNDWKSWLASIEDSEAQLLRDVESYDALKASRLRSQLAEHAKEGNNLLHSLVEQSKEASERDARREQREQRQLDEASRARINKLISTFSIPGLAYKTFKNSLNPEVAPNTGIWLREHSKYMAWEAQPSGILVLATPPGCGKSVLARSIVDEWLVNAHHDDTAVCYFFFKDSPMQTSLANGLCAVLHQLFDQRPEAVLAVSDEIERADGATLRGDPDALWDLFTTTLDHFGDAVTTKCVFDALDEADANSCDTLIRFLRDYFGGDNAKRFKVFATCRPYETVLQPLASIQSGLVNLEAQDEELEDISREIDCVIDHKLQLLARRDRNPPPAPVVEKIRESLKAPGNRTYLWVRLVFEVIEGTSTAYREKQWLRPLVSLPQSVDEAYEALLRRVPGEDQHAVRELISMRKGHFKSWMRAHIQRRKAHLQSRISA